MQGAQLPNLSEYNQSSFIGGMSLLGDDSRLGPNQYRIGFDITNRFDELDTELESQEDKAIPKGIIQEFVTFGNYLILFVSGYAFYRYYTDVLWTRIEGFQMSTTAPRYWTISVPVSTTNYVRIAATGVTNTKTSNPAGGIQLSSVTAAAQGNLPGLLVQDNINQPQFIFIGEDGTPDVRTTQTFAQWMISYTDANNTVVGPPNLNLIPSNAAYSGSSLHTYNVSVPSANSYTIVAGANDTAYSVDGGNTWISMTATDSYVTPDDTISIILKAASNTNVTATVELTTPVNDPSYDMREYVPIGNSMSWANGILMITSQDTNFEYRSVSGRPLDFVVNVVNTLAINTSSYEYTYTDPITGNDTVVEVPPFTQIGGGDATTTSYSVGVGGITCIRAQATGGWLVSASGANFSITLNTTQNAPTIFGEYTFLRAFLFNSYILSDRAIFDSIGDTRSIDLTGVRSFNAILQIQNEGRNSLFSSQIYAAFGGNPDEPDINPSIIQDPNNAAAILYNNYELYAVNTIFGPAIAKYDTVNSCWVSFDVQQVDGQLIKILSKIELSIQRLYAVTADNRLFWLYAGPNNVVGTVRTVGVTSNLLYANYDIKMNNPKTEIKVTNVRVILNKLQSTSTISLTPYINNRLSFNEGKITKQIKYCPPKVVSTNTTDLPDVNTQLENLKFALPDCEQGWKVFGLFSWQNGVITQYSFEATTLTPENPPNSQATTVLNV